MLSLSRPSRSDVSRRYPSRQRRSFARGLEHLEARCLLSTAGTATPAFGFGGFGGGPPAPPAPVNPAPIVLGAGSASQLPTGTLSPPQVAAAYDYGTLSSNGGAGTTIAIIDAYNDPTIKADLATFESQPGNTVGTGTLTVISQTGSTTALPAADPTGGWELEESLDVEYAHAMAPDANILLVEANDDSTSNLQAAVLEADKFATATTNPVVAVSMSWGAPAPSSPNAGFTTPGVTYFAASGDSGPGAEWPASSPDVVGVGGTTLNSTTTAGVTTYSETAWADSGGGAAAGVAQPTAYQTAYVTATGNSVLKNDGNLRGTPDVAYDADLNTGVAVVDTSTFTQGRSTYEYDWVEVGGTSVGTPQWAAIAADADAIRLAAKPSLGSLSGSTQFLPAIYAIASGSSYGSDFNDVQTGQSVLNEGRGRSLVNAAGPGYDFATGLGTPKVGSLVSALSASSLPQFPTASPTVKTNSSSSGTTVVTPSDIFSPITIVSFPGTPTSSPAPTPTTPSSPTPTPTSSSSSTTTVVVVNLPFAALLSPTESVVVLNAQNQLGLSTTTTTTAQGHAASTGTEAGVAANSLVATTSTAVLPPQSLMRSPAIERGSSPRFYREDVPLVPLEIKTPALGWDFVSRGAPVKALDLIAIAEHAAALGRGAEPGQPGPAAVVAPPAAPVAAEREVPEIDPAFDPVLAGAVVTLTGALALHTARSNGRSRRWPTFWPGR